MPDTRNQGAYLVRNPYSLPQNESGAPVYETEHPDVYKELYYRSLVQLQFPTKYGMNERDTLDPAFYLQRYYAVGGQDPLPKEPKSANNGLVYQEL